MVEDAITDGRRIAQLLASELSGLETGALAEATVVEADPDAAPSTEGTFAYGVDFHGERAGGVFLYPDHARVRLDVQGSDLPTTPPEDADLSVTVEEGAMVVRVGTGRAVKSAVDVIQRVLDAGEE